MSERVGDGIPIPDVIDPPESMMMQLCIPKNRDHMSAFFGALYELTMWNSWQEDEAHSGKELAAVWWRYYLSWDRTMSELDCEDTMSGCCEDVPRRYRINPDTGNLEQSNNGGATWGASAGGFQSVIVEPAPPVTSGVAATKCDAATNVKEQVQVWIDQVTTDFDTAVTLLEFGQLVIGAIAAAVLAILTDGVLIPLAAQALAVLGAALTAAWGAGKTVFVNYWTTEIKDQILCSAFCYMQSDGSFTAEGFSQFWAELNSELPPSPAKMLFMGFLSSVGKEGLNAMAASGMNADADCADCPCASCADKFHLETAVFGGGVIIHRDEDSITIRSTDVGGGRQQIAITTGTVGVGCVTAMVEVVEGAYASFYDGIPVASAISPANIVFNVGGACCNTFITWVDGGAPYALKYTLAGC